MSRTKDNTNQKVKVRIPCMPFAITMVVKVNNTYHAKNDVNKFASMDVAGRLAWSWKGHGRNVVYIMLKGEQNIRA